MPILDPTASLFEIRAAANRILPGVRTVEPCFGAISCSGRRREHGEVHTER